jgi:hypothetical protein
MLSSSGLDGVYMATWMPSGWFWLGLVLNTMSDVANLTLMFWFGRLRQSPRGSKRYRLALGLLPSEAIAVLYSWFFSWRQLRTVLSAVEPDAWRWVAPVAAGFIPLLLAFIGYAQSLLAGKLEEEPAQVRVREPVVIANEPEPEPIATTSEPEPEPVAVEQITEPVAVAESFSCLHCSETYLTQNALNGHMRKHARSNGHEPVPESMEAGMTP